MKKVKIIAILFGCIPIIGWLISMPYNLWALGTPFTATGEWNNLPLWIVTLPLSFIAEILFDGNWFSEQRYVLILIYTVICSIIYTAVAILLAMCLQSIIKKLKKQNNEIKIS